MPLIDLCNGNGAFVGTLALTTGVGLVFNQYWKVGFLCQDENDPRVPHGWKVSAYYLTILVLPVLFSTAFGIVILVIISNCCKTIPPNHDCISTSPALSPSPLPIRNQAWGLA